ncbi:MAG: swr complex subunit [Trizodia sp. TS-e1964]|nr:MAG: swr complex subunit [Trizodia sp. TS-e1964]
MTSADVRDMLDLPSNSHDHPRPAKKTKTVEKRPDGMPRELFALLGERLPPIAINEQPKYKERPKWTHKAQKWELTPFRNPARTDGLVLKHWRKKRDLGQKVLSDDEVLVAALDADSPVVEEEKAGIAATAFAETPAIEPDYHFAKFNVKISGPKYTDAEYSLYLVHEDWSREETDYLVDLVVQWDLRWIIIADRYEYVPTEASGENKGEDAMALVPTAKPRTMEDMKARYYQVSAKMMELTHTVASMSPAEFDLHQRMLKYDPQHEKKRKQFAENLLQRPPEDLAEETFLLSELRRIVISQERLQAERKELFARLQSPQSIANTQMYQTSQGLTQLMQMLLSADKNKKRRSILGTGDTGSSPAVPTSGHSLNSGNPKDGPNREPASATTGPNTKKGSISQAVERKKLTPKEEELYGVSHHDRLSSGVQFRHEKAIKLVQAKSNVQAQRVMAALTELSIPPRLSMPTAKVCAEYERLVQSIHLLLDVRKVAEKVESEIKIAMAQRDERERRERADGGEDVPEPADTGEKMDVDLPEEEKTEDAPVVAVEDAAAADDAATASLTRQGTVAGRKRSASVMSMASNKSAKRLKK